VAAEAETTAAETSMVAKSSVPEFSGPEAAFAYVGLYYLARCCLKP
jgi:hypothetical protein